MNEASTNVVCVPLYIVRSFSLFLIYYINYFYYIFYHNLLFHTKYYKFINKLLFLNSIFILSYANFLISSLLSLLLYHLLWPNGLFGLNFLHYFFNSIVTGKQDRLRIIYIQFRLTNLMSNCVSRQWVLYFQGNFWTF